MCLLLGREKLKERNKGRPDPPLEILSWLKFCAHGAGMFMQTKASVVEQSLIYSYFTELKKVRCLSSTRFFKELID